MSTGDDEPMADDGEWNTERSLEEKAGKYGIVHKRDGPLDSEDSVIALLRLDKGILEPTSVRDQDFQQVFDKVMEGADFGNDEEEKNEKKSSGRGLKIFIALIIGFIAWRRFKRFKKGNSLNGTPLERVKKDEVEWYRDIPMDGHLAALCVIIHRPLSCGWFTTATLK